MSVLCKQHNFCKLPIKMTKTISTIWGLHSQANLPYLVTPAGKHRFLLDTLLVQQYLSMHLRLVKFKLIQWKWFTQHQVEQPHVFYFFALMPHFRKHTDQLWPSLHGLENKCSSIHLIGRVRNRNTPCIDKTQQCFDSEGVSRCYISLIMT